jgi:uncharacterized protein (TIGR02996 family)
MEMLATVVADLADHRPKLVYADWLEEQGDTRGPYLRAFVQALADGRPPRAPKGLPAGWSETVGALLVHRIHQFGLEKYRDRLLALARPVLEINKVKLTTEAKLPLACSKLGGLPALPKGTPWPLCEKGPLRFYAQFRLADLRPAVAAFHLPADGLLSFFLYQDWAEDESGYPTILFTPAEAGLALLEPPAELDEDHGRPGRSATFTLRESLDLPKANEPWGEKLGFPGDGEEGRWDVRESYWKLQLAQRGVTHVLFGYARNRHIISDPIPGPEWEQLISLASDDVLKWGWGDGHELFWHIRTDDLRAGRFDRTETESG